VFTYDRKAVVPHFVKEEHPEVPVYEVPVEEAPVEEPVYDAPVEEVYDAPVEDIVADEVVEAAPEAVEDVAEVEAAPMSAAEIGEELQIADMINDELLEEDLDRKDEIADAMDVNAMIQEDEVVEELVEEEGDY
jgi:hypothetical protein